MREIQTYKPLILPKDTAWERKTIRRYLPWWLKEFCDGIRNIFKWIPTLYKDRDWDYGYIYDILKKKLEHQRAYLVKHNRVLGIPEKNRDITICLNLLERVQIEYYGVEYQDYCTQELLFTPVPGTKLSEIDIETTKESFDKYTANNKLTHKKVLIYLSTNQHRYSIPVSDKGLQCRLISQFKQQKAKRILFKVLEQKIEHWWD